MSDRAPGELPPNYPQRAVTQRVHGKNGAEWHGYVRTVEAQERKREDDLRVKRSWIAALVVLNMVIESDSMGVTASNHATVKAR